MMEPTTARARIKKDLCNYSLSQTIARTELRKATRTITITANDSF